MIQTHNGIQYEKIRRFETDCYIHVIDLQKAKMSIYNGFRTVPEAVAEKGAQLGFNAGGWGAEGHKNVANEWLIIEGRIIQMNSFDARPCMHISKSGVIEFLNRPNLSNSWNIIGFDRLIAVNGSWNTRINDNSVNPRTIYGKTAEGKLFVMVCEGRLPDQKGLTFAECWKVAQEYNVISCGNADGGYSSAVVNTSISSLALNKSYLGEVPSRRVVYQVLFHADATGEVPPPVDPSPSIDPPQTAADIIRSIKEVSVTVEDINGKVWIVKCTPVSMLL